MMDDMEREAALTDTVNRSAADEIAGDALNAKREKKVGHSYVTDEVAEQARESVKAWNRDLESVSSTLEDVHGPSNAPFVRSTPGPDDAPAFSASEKSATGQSEVKRVVEEPDVLQAETVVGAPDVTETGVLGEPRPEKESEEDASKEEDSKDEDKDKEAKDKGSSVADDLRPDKKTSAKKPAAVVKKN
jgi:hypothetical protein